MDNASVSKKGNMNDKKEYPTAAKLLSWLPAIFVAAAISWFSAQPAAESTEMSDTVSRLILLLGTKLGFFHGNPAQYADLIELMSFPVRKAAHMTEYLVFYCTVRFGLHFTYRTSNMKLRLLIALAIVFLYACTDEFHQLFVLSHYEEQFPNLHHLLQMMVFRLQLRMGQIQYHHEFL